MEKIYREFDKFKEMCLQNAENLFKLPNREIACADERVIGPGIRIAGSGILMPEDELFAIWKNTEADGVWSHADCGAAKLFAEQNNINSAKADTYARERIMELAKKFDIRYLGHKIVTPDFHPARVLYYDASGRFNYGEAREFGFPYGFVVSRRYLGRYRSKETAQMLTSIAFGDHGFGEKFFSSENPFVLIPIADATSSRLKLQSLITELEPIRLTYKDKISIKGLEMK